MLAVSAKKFASLIAEASRGRFGEEKAKQLKAVAEGSFGVSFAKDAFSLQIRQLLEQITLLENQIKELEEQVFSLTWLSRFLFFDQ
ncbi:hypothetical protein FACS189481_3940 [Clostridia bacterium]|nr:hypothetical protein FACS189481_3940 [Clostridia bacterium]